MAIVTRALSRVRMAAGVGGQDRESDGGREQNLWVLIDSTRWRSQ